MTSLSFIYLELRSFHRNCHPTLSRQLALWLRCTPNNRWRGPALFATAWALLAAHIALLEVDTAPVFNHVDGSPPHPEPPDTGWSAT